jgi:Asp-tRNA(Asn)/Glu-tRNA(Gln) amidotransferase A subunit family amidase
MMMILGGVDVKDEFTSINALAADRRRKPTSFVDAVRHPVLAGKRLGVLRQVFGTHKGINSVLDRTLGELKASGAELVDVEIAGLEEFKQTTSVYILRSKADINNFLSSQEGLQHLKVEDLVEKGEYHRSLDLLSAIAQGPADGMQSPHFSKALTAIQQFQRIVASVFAKFELDAMIYPTCQELAPKTQDVLDMK